MNKESARVSILHTDAALLERGRDVRPLGANLVLADVFDAGKSDVYIPAYGSPVT